MDFEYKTILIITGCGIVTFLPRVLPLIFTKQASFPEWYKIWLSFIPITIMTALVTQELILSKNTHDIAASVVCLACAILSRSLFVTVLLGIIVVSFLNHFHQ
jgi:branched-subunit amino acid transport protein